MSDETAVHLLSQGAGFGVLLGVGAVFAGGMILTTKLLLKYLHEDHNNTETFSVANRSVGTALTTLAVYSLWSWANELLWTLTMVYTYGIQASYYYGAGLAIQIAVMATLGIHAKKKIPKAHTSLEIIALRYGKVAHLLYLFLCLVNNLISCLSMLLGTSLAISIIAGNLHLVASTLLIPFGVLLYTTFGGLKATFLTDYVHTLILLIVLCYVNTAVLTSDQIGGLDGLYEKLVASDGDRYIEGNYQGSHITGKSKGAVIFGLILTAGNFGLCIMDSLFWQKAFSANVRLTVPAYITSSVLIFANVWPLGAIIGGAGLVLSQLEVWPTYPRDMSTYEINSGYVLPYALKAVLGNGAVGGLLLVIYLAVTLTVLAQLVSVLLITSFDIFRKYFRPNATNKQMMWVSHISVVGFGLFAPAFAIMLHYVGVDMTWMGYFQPLLICPGVLPLVLSITWDRQLRLAAIVSPIVGMVFGFVVWTTVAYQFYGEVNITTLGYQFPALYGALTALFLPGIVLIVISTIQNETFDWLVLQDADLEVKADGQGELDEVEVDAKEKSNEVTVATELLNPKHISTKEMNFWIKFATIATVSILLITWVVWPMPLYRDWIFTSAYFKGYTTMGLIWLYSSLIIVGLLPLWSGRHTFATVIRGVWYDLKVKCSRHKT